MRAKSHIRWAALLLFIPGGCQHEAEQAVPVVGQIHVVQPVIDLGDVPLLQEGHPATFEIRNVGNGPIEVKDVVTSCRCAMAEEFMRDVRAGAQQVLRVRVRPESTGPSSATIRLVTDDRRSPEIVLSVL